MWPVWLDQVIETDKRRFCPFIGTDKISNNYEQFLKTQIIAAIKIISNHMNSMYIYLNFY